MTQAKSRSNLQRIQALIKIPQEWEAIANQTQKSLPGLYSPTEDNQKALLLVPGVEREIWLQVENTTGENLQWEVDITGDFPSQWCQGFAYHPAISRNIIPGDKKFTNLYFQVPIDFFESNNALNNKNQRLQLNYQAEIYIYGEYAGEKQLIAYQHFYIFVRPHTSYIALLPEIYHQRDFLNRLLMIFEQGYDPSIQTLANFWAYLDPLTAPKAMLSFLAKWVAWEMNSRWELKQQRRLIKNAVELYRWRGSRRGLRLYIHLFTDLPLDEDLPEAEKSICIEESFSTSFVLGTANLIENPKLGGGKPFYFTVTLRPQKIEDINEALVQEVIEHAKPAFCTYRLQINPRTTS
jgi:phage tail-like protein